MKTKLTILLLIVSAFQCAFSQNVTPSYPRYIEVTGTAQKEIKPDLILFDICIQEYYKEQYEAGKTYKDYATKVALQDIEKELLSELSKIGITKEQISIIEGNNFSKTSAATTLELKTIQITVSDLKKINEIIQKITIKGISYMRIAEVKNKDLAPQKKQVKIDAMNDAKEKATILLSTVGNTLGQVISIEEVDTNPYANMSTEEIHSLATYASSSNQTNDTNKNIVLKYNIKVRFEIK